MSWKQFPNFSFHEEHYFHSLTNDEEKDTSCGKENGVNKRNVGL